LKALTISLSMLLTGCATVQSAVCPSLPPVPAMEPAPPERSYQDQMESFSQGLLPQQTKQPLTSGSVKRGSKQ
jgi:hypothetical protein